MKITVPHHVKVSETESGGVFVDSATSREFALDAHEMMLWKFVTLGGEIVQAPDGPALDPVGPDHPVYQESRALLGRLAAQGMILLGDDGDPGPPDPAAGGGWPGRPARVWRDFREWLGWRLDERFDRRFGTDTSGRMRVSEMGVIGDNARFAVYYEATPTRVFRKALALAVPDPAGYAFIDYGSGKGRALLLASDLPFGRVIGVELSGQLHATAQHNIRVYRGGRQRCPDVTSICCDATRFELPDDDLAIYFYTPFVGPVFDKVLERIGEAVARRPRRLIVFSYNSRMDQIARLKAQPYLTRHREFRLGFEVTRVDQRPLHVFANH